MRYMRAKEVEVGDFICLLDQKIPVLVSRRVGMKQDQQLIGTDSIEQLYDLNEQLLIERENEYRNTTNCRQGNRTNHKRYKRGRSHSHRKGRNVKRCPR